LRISVPLLPCAATAIDCWPMCAEKPHRPTRFGSDALRTSATLLVYVLRRIVLIRDTFRSSCLRRESSGSKDKLRSPLTIWRQHENKLQSRIGKGNKNETLIRRSMFFGVKAKAFLDVRRGQCFMHVRQVHRSCFADAPRPLAAEPVLTITSRQQSVEDAYNRAESRDQHIV